MLKYGARLQSARFEAGPQSHKRLIMEFANPASLKVRSLANSSFCDAPGMACTKWKARFSPSSSWGAQNDHRSCSEEAVSKGTKGTRQENMKAVQM
jgi:hypothetical protein